MIGSGVPPDEEKGDWSEPTAVDWKFPVPVVVPLPFVFPAVLVGFGINPIATMLRRLGIPLVTRTEKVEPRARAVDGIVYWKISL